MFGIFLFIFINAKCVTAGLMPASSDPPNYPINWYSMFMDSHGITCNVRSVNMQRLSWRLLHRCLRIESFLFHRLCRAYIVPRN